MAQRGELPKHQVWGDVENPREDGATSYSDGLSSGGRSGGEQDYRGVVFHSLSVSSLSVGETENSEQKKEGKSVEFDNRNLLGAASSSQPKAASGNQDDDEGEGEDEDGNPFGRVPTWSAGAALHESGNCKSCAWFWKPSGCREGEGCSLCHMCDWTEIKRRKAEKFAEYKAKRKAARATRLAGPLPPGRVNRDSAGASRASAENP
mmetsp:Transcript_51961/g.123696  ORF Transcript_51961/g.123696 Transcript_51961/m.123696 type:complete len:206 (-) Transcript_51961:119-736(-)